MDLPSVTSSPDADNFQIAEKKEIVLKRLQERSDERQVELLKRKDENDKLSAKNETVEYFINTFESNVNLIRNRLADADSTPKDLLSELFDDLVLKQAELQKFVSDSAFYLTSHELSVKQQSLNNLSTDISTEREKYFPKKKFAFKNKKKQSSTATSESSQDQVVKKPNGMGNNSVPSYDLSANEYRLHGKSQQTIYLAAEEVENKDVVVSNLSQCRLMIKGSPNAIHLNDLKDCEVISTPCSRSIFIERCVNTELVLACQQLRIHDARNCLFCIHVTSKAIIEDSKGLRFSPYLLDYPTKSEDFTRAQLNMTVNNWRDVDDFNWLVKDKQSPNWSAVPEAEWKSFTLD